VTVLIHLLQDQKQGNEIFQDQNKLSKF